MVYFVKNPFERKCNFAPAILFLLQQTTAGAHSKLSFFFSIVPTMSSAFPVLRLDINIYVLVVRITVGSALLNLRLGLLIYRTSRCPFVLDWYGSESE